MQQHKGLKYLYECIVLGTVCIHEHNNQLISQLAVSSEKKVRKMSITF